MVVAELETQFVVLFVLFPVVICLSFYFVRRQVLKRADHLIERWCEANGFRLISKRVDYSAFFRVPLHSAALGTAPSTSS